MHCAGALSCMCPVILCCLRSNELIASCLAAGSAITSEMQLLEADRPEGEWRVVLPRRPDVEAEVSHRGDHLFILLRDAARPNSELLVAPVSNPSASKVRRSRASWQVPVAPSELGSESAAVPGLCAHNEQGVMMFQGKVDSHSRRKCVGRSRQRMLPLSQVLLEHRKDVKLESIVASKDFLAVFHRTNGLQVGAPLPTLLAPLPRAITSSSRRACSP